MQLHGSITALATPFTASGALDPGAWHGLLEAQLAGGIQGLVVAGSTGEAAMLSDTEFVELIRAAVEQVGGRVPVLAGAGLSGTARTIDQCRLACDAGADALLVVTPPYVRPTQDGLLRHFEAVADAVERPVVLYNVPPRTGVDLLPETVAALAPHPNIAGIKEAVADIERIRALLPLRGPQFALFTGDDGTACAAQLAGADGVISVVANVVPAAFTAMGDLARAGQTEAAQALDAELAPLYAAMALEPNPIPVKAILAGLGLCQDSLRLPLLPLSSRHRAAAHATLERIARLEARHAPAQ
ncbi:MAG: 4-hydroxy-tetrahydrodipicolinate synthase [Lysobacteraceae bacterium]